MFNKITHINKLGTSKLQNVCIFVHSRLTSFKQANQKTQDSAKFPCLKAFKQLRAFFILPMFITLKLL